MSENKLSVFEHEQFGSIRSVVINNEPWFVAADLCSALEHSNVSAALTRLDDDEKAKLNLGLSGGLTNVVNESGMYELILGSRKKEAKEFKRWIKSEVLPMIRKTGGVYLSADAAERIIEDPDLIISLATMVKEQKAQLAEAQPKVEYYDRLIDHGNSLSIRDTSKSIGVKESVLKNALLENQYLYRDKKGRLRPYAEKNKGYFVLKEFTTETGNYASVQTLITVEGRQMILKLLGREDGKEQAV